MPKALTVTGLTAAFAVGLLAVAVVPGGRAAETATATTSTEASTTAPSTTVTATTTVQQTTTERVIVPTSATTTSTSTSENGTAPWVWVVIGILTVALIVLVVLLTQHKGGVPAEERRRRLDSAAGSWVAQGWALDSQTADSAVLRRGNEMMLISVDESGHVSTRPLSSSP